MNTGSWTHAPVRSMKPHWPVPNTRTRRCPGVKRVYVHELWRHNDAAVLSMKAVAVSRQALAVRFPLAEPVRARGEAFGNGPPPCTDASGVTTTWPVRSIVGWSARRDRRGRGRRGYS